MAGADLAGDVQGGEQVKHAGKVGRVKMHGTRCLGILADDPEGLELDAVRVVLRRLVHQDVAAGDHEQAPVALEGVAPRDLIVRISMPHQCTSSL